MIVRAARAARASRVVAAVLVLLIVYVSAAAAALALPIDVSSFGAGEGAGARLATTTPPAVPAIVDAILATQPGALAIDRLDNVYVTNVVGPLAAVFNSTDGSVRRYDMGTAAIAVNSQGVVVVSDRPSAGPETGTYIDVIPPEGYGTSLLIPSGNQFPFTNIQIPAFAFDVDDNLWVVVLSVDASSLISLYKFNSNYSDFALLFNVSNPSIPLATSMAVDAENRLYMAGPPQSSPGGYAASVLYRSFSDGRPDVSFNNLTIAAVSVAVDGAGYIYASAPGANHPVQQSSIIVKYDPNGNRLATIAPVLPFTAFGVNAKGNFFFTFVNSSAPSGYTVAQQSPALQTLVTYVRADDVFAQNAVAIAIDSEDRIYALSFIGGFCVGDRAGAQLQPCGAPLPFNSSLVGMAVDDAQRVYWIEPNTGKTLYIYNIDGQLERALELKPYVPCAGYYYPNVAVDRAGTTVFIMDACYSRVIVAPPNGTDTYVLFANKSVDFEGDAIALGADNVLYVLGLSDLSRISLDGKLLSTVGLMVGFLYTAVAADAFSNAYVVAIENGENGYVIKVGPTGALDVLVSGYVPSVFGYNVITPRSVAVSTDGSLVYVLDQPAQPDITPGMSNTGRIIVCNASTGEVQHARKLVEIVEMRSLRVLPLLRCCVACVCVLCVAA